MLEIDHLEDVLYFIVLNQSPKGVVYRLGDYHLVRHLRSILLKVSEISRLDRPSEETQFRDVVAKICQITGLQDPFEELSTVLGYVNEELAKEQSSRRSIDWISRRVLEWILSRPFDALRWYEDPSRIMKQIPVWKIRPRDVITDFQINHYDWSYRDGKPITSEEVALIRHHSRYGDFAHVIRGLFFSQRSRCPYHITAKPRVCHLCETCSGWIPDPVLTSDCPAVAICSEQGVDICGIAADYKEEI